MKIILAGAENGIVKRKQLLTVWLMILMKFEKNRRNCKNIMFGGGNMSLNMTKKCSIFASWYILLKNK